MNVRTSGFVAIMVLSAFVLPLPACQVHDEKVEATPTPRLSDDGATDQAMTQIISGKPGAPVTLAHRMTGEPSVGSVTDIRITLTSTQATDSMVMRLNAKDDLQLRENGALIDMGPQQAGQASAYTVQVNPVRDGAYYVNVVVEVEAHGAKSARAFAVPVAVGGVDMGQGLKTDGTITVSPEGEQIHSLPAQQSE